MNLNISKVKIIVTMPVNSLDEVRMAICQTKAGIIGNYSYCTTSSKCIGTFIPNEKANPVIGKNGSLEFVEEEKLEVVCDINIAKQVIQNIRKVHPYEEPVIDIIPLINESDLI